MKKDSIGIENRKSRVEEIDIKGKRLEIRKHDIGKHCIQTDDYVLVISIKQ